MKSKEKKMRDLGDLVFYKRRDLRISQKALAKRVGVSNQSLGYIERGSSVPRGLLLLTLIKELGINTKELLSVIEDDKQV